MLYLIAVPVEYTVHGTEHIHHPDPPAGNPVPVTSTHSRKILSCMLIQKLLGLVNLRRQKGTPPTIRMIQKHKLAVILADFVFGQGTFSVSVSFLSTHPHTQTHMHTHAHTHSTHAIFPHRHMVSLWLLTWLRFPLRTLNLSRPSVRLSARRVVASGNLSWYCHHQLQLSSST